MSRMESDVLIVGGGPAGLSAAVAASANATVTIVDDNPHFGGQIWRAELGNAAYPEARSLIQALDDEKVTLLTGTQVFGVLGERVLMAEAASGRIELAYSKLIIATGARERFLPFPGWTLPGIYGAGGLQALVKGGLEIADRRVIIAGTGPLLLAVADHFKRKGVTIEAIVEQASASRLNRFGLGLWRSPSKLKQALALRFRLRGVPYLRGSWITAAQGEGKVESVTLSRRGKKRTMECDLLACGFHLVPNTELAALLGCRIEDGFVAVDHVQQTSLPDVYCAGEPTGIAGLDSSLIEGWIAGLAASGQSNSELISKRNEAREFGYALNKTFALRPELKELPNDDTIVCRCEDVRYEQLSEFTGFREAKLQTRCGMGPCQGRVCGPATEFLFGWEPPTVRPPIFPVKMENL